MSESSVACLGVFDGVHLGHQQLLRLCVQRAKELSVPALVYTFFPHPVKILFPEACPPLIQTQRQKIAKLQTFGIDQVIVEAFTSEFARLSPEVFFRRVILEQLKAKEVIVGYDFTFGADRKGTTSVLRTLGKAHNVRIHIVDAYLSEGHLVSSSVIRKQIQEGHVDMAAKLIGESFTLVGKVISGDGMGQQLGFPTANLKVENELIPGHGVYATRSLIDGQWQPSVSNIGTRPTFSGQDVRIETHVLNYTGDLLHKELELQFLARLRSEQKFSSPEELITQIHKDIEAAKRFFQGPADD